jgi:hypothetical protein
MIHTTLVYSPKKYVILSTCTYVGYVSDMTSLYAYYADGRAGMPGNNAVVWCAQFRLLPMPAYN